MASWSELATPAPGIGGIRRGASGCSTGLLSDHPRSWQRRVVHPVSPIIGAGRLFVFMEPTSPKGPLGLRARHWYALHNGVPNALGTGGEFSSSAATQLSWTTRSCADACAAAAYQPEDRYILFELEIDEAGCNGYGDVLFFRNHSVGWCRMDELRRRAAALETEVVVVVAYT